jgi:hypothetical protein
MSRRWKPGRVRSTPDRIPPLDSRVRRRGRGRESLQIAWRRGGRLSRISSVYQYWPIFFLLVVLKVPVLAMIYLVWWASQPVPEVESGDDDGGDHGRRRSKRPKFPRGPRRGPHGPDLRDLPGSPHEGRKRQVDRTRSRETRLRDSSRSRETERK